MPRDLPLGNGNLLVTYDQSYQIRDLYWPYVGQENHALGHAFRIGVWVDDQSLSVSPLTWSQAAYVSTLLTFLQRKQHLKAK